MFCTKCGKQIPDISKFCPECGAVIEQKPAAPVQQPTPVQQPVVQQPVVQQPTAPTQQPAPNYQQPYQYPQPPMPPKKNHTGLIIGLIAAGVVIIALVVLLIIFIGKSNQNTPEVTQPISTTPPASTTLPEPEPTVTDAPIVTTTEPPQTVAPITNTVYDSLTYEGIWNYNGEYYIFANNAVIYFSPDDANFNSTTYSVTSDGFIVNGDSYTVTKSYDKIEFDGMELDYVSALVSETGVWYSVDADEYLILLDGRNGYIAMSDGSVIEISYNLTSTSLTIQNEDMEYSFDCSISGDDLDTVITEGSAPLNYHRYYDLSSIN